MIPYGRQQISKADVDAVIEVLQSDFLTQGPKVPAFEATLAQFVDAKHAIAVNSATSALHIACLALGLSEGDTLWTSPNTFVASANCALYCGAQVDFVDIDPKTYNMCPDKLEEKLIKAKRDNCLPKVVVPVHFSGQPCDMKAIHALSETYGFHIIEDASHAIGARYDDAPVGNCEYSDITVFSFHPVKIITTAEGGAAVTNDDELATKLGYLRSHGVVRDPKLMSAQATNDDNPGWYYEQIDLGYNYRMTDLHAALGISQLTRLREFVQMRQGLAKRYDAKLGPASIIKPVQLPGTASAWHLYVIQFPDARLKAPVFQGLRAQGIGVNVHYIPVHTQPFYRNLGFHDGDFPNAEDYYARAISIPLFAGMTQDQQDKTIESVSHVIGAVGATV